MMRLLLLLLALPLAQESRPTSRPVDRPGGEYAPRASADDPRPAEIPTPVAPPIPRGEEQDTPDDERLGPNSAVVGRFTAQGQDVDYTFQAAQGETSLFELATWGNARGWQSAVLVRILDEAGFELARTRRSGGATYRQFTAFTAPHDGVFHYRLSAEEQYCRYTLVRHTDFRAPVAGTAEPFGERGQVHGYLADGGDRRRFRFDLEAGDEVGLRVSPGNELARKERRNHFRTQAARPVLPGFAAPTSRPTERGESMRGERMRGAGDGGSDFPKLALQVFAGDGRPIGSSSHFVMFRAPSSGSFEVEVRASGRGQGGLFYVDLFRSIEKHEVQGHVGDEDDDSLADVRLLFMVEPDFELVATARTDEDGLYRTRVPAGSYSVFLRGEGRELQRIRTTVHGPRELNTIYLDE